MSEKKVGKRLLTWVLVLVMTLSLLPLNVLAEEFDDSMQLEPTTEEDMIETDEETFDEAEPAALSARKKNYTEEAQFYYLKSPTSDPYSNGPNDWGKCLGNGEIDTKNLKFVWDWDSFQYKNAYNVEGCVTKWPDGVDQDGVLTKDLTSGSHWMTIFNAFQKDCEDKNGITGLTPNDVESITLKPFKVSRYNNGSTPDKHVDCKVEIKCTRVVTATFYFVDSEDKNVQLLSKNYKINGYIPEYDIADAEREANKLVPEDYELIKWYTDSAFTTEANPKAELTGNVDFYCKAEPVKTYTVTYTDGVVGETIFEDQVTSGLRKGTDTPAFNGDEPTRAGYTFTGWDPEVDETVTEDVTYTAQWEANKYSYTVKYYKDDATTPFETFTSKEKYKLNSEITSIENKCPDGYALDTDKSTAMPYTITDGDNIIEVYYTKRSDLSYTVNYYWNGTTQTVADSKTVENQTFGEEVTVSPAEIEGYTPVSEDSQAITIGTDSNVITFYYYKNVKLTANSKTEPYDGTEKSVSGFTGAPDGADFSAITVGAKGTTAGNYPAEFPESTAGTVDKTEKYIVEKCENGKLTISPIDKVTVTITGHKDTAIYDGTEKSVTGYDVASSNVLYTTDDFTFSGTAEAKGTDADTYPMNLKAEQFKNKSKNFTNVEFVVTDGELTISPIADKVTVTIKGNTKTETYDGTEKTVEGYTFTSSNDFYTNADFALKDDSKAEAKGTNTGTYKMNLTADMFKNTSKNFTNVKFEVTDGSLTITKCLVTITAKNVTTVYDGKSPVVKDYTILREVSNGDPVNTLPADHKIASYVTYGSGVDAGEYEWFSMDGAKIVDKNGEDVTSNYQISYNNGMLTINKRSVTLTSANASKPYDGTALTNKNVTVGGEGFADGEGATYNVTGSQTEVGKSDNEFTYELNANTKASNYNITMYKGELVITAADSVAYKVEHYKQNLDGSYNKTPDDIDLLSGTAGTHTAAAAKGYPGFTPGTVTQEKIKSDGTTTIRIQYTRNSYTLTINYVYRDGSKAAESHIETILYGKDYSVTSPKISGYTADKLVVSGTMPAENITVKVTYTKNGGHHPRPKPTVEIEDDDALGLNTTDHFAYIVGYGNGEVRPQNNITRAEVATIFFRLLTDDVRDENLTKTNRYSDVTRADWYNTAVSTLSSMGIITGYPDGTFRPNAAITRAEFAAIAARFDSNGDKTTAKFSDIATHWAKDEISIAYNNGWITGYPDGTFGPQRDITRAETMTLVNRVLNRQPETEDDLLPNMTVWTDNANPKAWYYLAVQEATNSHYYEFKTNSKYEKWTELRETRDWTLLEK